MPQTLPMLPQPRPVDANWKCQRSGDCCTLPPEVVMTREEQRHLMLHIPEGIKSQWREVDEQFVAVKAGPCPFFVFHECLVYEHRPYNCRRFACMRPDPKAERFEVNASVLLGCTNLDVRVATSRVARRLYATIQRKAQRWARKYGWRD